MKRHLAKVHKKVPKTKKFWIPALTTIIVLQAAAILYMWPKVGVAWRQSTLPPDSSPEIKLMISSAVNSVLSEAVIDPINERVYLPEARLYLPLNEDTRNILYQYVPADQKNSYPSELNLTTKAQTQTLVETMAQVPCVQRMVRVTINSSDNERYNEKRSGQVSLGDDRTLNFFVNSNKNCANRWITSSPDDLVGALKQAKSY